MTTGQMHLSVSDGVGAILIDRPAARNAMTWNMYQELGAICERIGSDPDIRVATIDCAIRRNFQDHVYAMFWITKAAVPLLKPGATIINTSSVNAYDPGENIIDYAATKGAIMIFTKGLAKQLAPQSELANVPGTYSNYRRETLLEMAQ